MLRRTQPGGKCWTARSWSVRKTTTFLPSNGSPDVGPRTPRRLAFAFEPPSTAAAGVARAADSSSSLRVRPRLSSR